MRGESVADLLVHAPAPGPVLALLIDLKMTTWANRPAASTVADHLSAPLRYGFGRLPTLLPGVFSCRRLVARRNGLPAIRLLAFILGIDAIIGTAVDLYADFAIRLEAVLADQRTDPTGLGFDSVQDVEGRELGFKLCSSVLVEGQQRPLGRRIPVAVRSSG